MPRMRKLPPPPAGTANGQTTLRLGPPRDEHLDISALETWLWDAACAIRGATDAPKFKDFILPLVFYKRLSDVFDDEFSERAAEFGDEATAREIIEADHADALKSGRKIEVINRHRLGLKNTEPDILGRVYEYLLRKFAEGQGQSAGEFYTPKEVGWLMALMIDPEPYTTIYDPCCGSSGLLIKARL